MKNYIEELYAKIAQKDAERAKIQATIDNLTSRQEKARSKQKTALASDDNAAYLDAFREIKECEAEIEGSKDLLKAKQGIGFSPREVNESWSKTVAEFEHDRKKAVADYQKAKRALAMQFLDLCRGQRVMNELRNDATSLIEPHGSLILGSVPTVERDNKAAYNFFKDIFEEIGVNLFDL